MKHAEKLAKAYQKFVYAGTLAGINADKDFLAGYAAAVTELRSEEAERYQEPYLPEPVTNAMWADWLGRDEG